MPESVAASDVPEKTLDAVYIPGRFATGTDTIKRVFAITELSDKLLKVDPLKRERSYGRAQANGMQFFTKDPSDTLLFPYGHPQQGSERYHWEDQKDGIKFGYLMEDARAK